jgi:hypothetical protein
VSGQPISNEKDLEELVSLAAAAGTVANLNLRGLRDMPAAALGGLSKLQSLSNLDLTASPLVTHEAVAHLAACKQLKLLRVGGSDMQVDHAVIAELQALLPDCLIRHD